MTRVNLQHSIATTYRNYIFRSRLEAKWAVFFDACGWQWSYEPFDFGGWIPDFALGETNILVEVKPFFELKEWTEQLDKINKSGCKREVLLLGADPVKVAGVPNSVSPLPGYDAPHLSWTNGAPQFGWLMCPLEGAPVAWSVADVHFGFTEGNSRLGLCPMDAGWHNKIWKAPDRHDANKWCRVHLDPLLVERALVSKWAHACNCSQWMKIEEGGSNSGQYKSA